MHSPYFLGQFTNCLENGQVVKAYYYAIAQHSVITQCKISIMNIFAIILVNMDTIVNK